MTIYAATFIGKLSSNIITFCLRVNNRVHAEPEGIQKVVLKLRDIDICLGGLRSTGLSLEMERMS